jgi:hypothetical protein
MLVNIYSDPAKWKDGYQELIQAINQMVQTGCIVNQDMLMDIFTCKIKEHMQFIKKELQDELFATKILEKIIPERKYSQSDMIDHEFYKKFEKWP